MGANANSTLLAGAEEGSLEKVQKSLEAGADPNVKDNNGLDPLTWAAKKGHAEIAKLLLQKGASAEEEDKENLLPLHHAAIKGKDKCLAAMLEVGVKVKVTVKSGDKAGYTALHFAAEKGHTSACAVLLKHGADVNAPEKRQKYTPLHLAAGKGRDKVVELLLESGAEIQATDVDENTALHKAAAAGMVKVVELLIAKRANVIAMNKMRQTAYHVAESAEIRALLPEPEEYNSNIDDMLKEHRRTSKMASSGFSFSRKFSTTSAPLQEEGTDGPENSSSTIESSSESRRRSSGGIIAGLANRVLSMSGKGGGSPGRVHAVSSSVQEMGVLEEEAHYPGDDGGHGDTAKGSSLPKESTVLPLDGAEHVTIQTAVPAPVPAKQ